MRSDVAGRDVTRYLKLLLRREGLLFKTTSEFEIVRCMKEVRHTAVVSLPQLGLQPTTPVLKAGHPVSYSFVFFCFLFSLDGGFLGVFLILSFFLLVCYTQIRVFPYIHVFVFCLGS